MINVSEEFFKKFGKRFPPEAYLCREEEAGSTMFLIHTGKVAIIKNTPAGEKVLAVLGGGNFFGEMALMGMQDRRAASAKTVTETSVLELNQVAFEGLVRRSPEIAIEVIKVLTQRVRDANGKVSALYHKDDRIRICTYLNHVVVDKGEDAPGDQPGRCAVFSVEGAASDLGVEVAKIEQFLNVAKKARMVGVNGAWVWVPFPKYLKTFGQYLVAHSS